MKDPIKLQTISSLKTSLDSLINYGSHGQYDLANEVIRDYILMIMAEENSETKEALIYMIKEMNLYPEYRNLVETLITFG